jgi:hypothetical protein
MRVLATVFEIITLVGAICGAGLLFSGFLPGQSAIQTGAAAAAGVGLAAIPYCMAGVFHRASMRSLASKSFEAEYDTVD